METDPQTIKGCEPWGGIEVLPAIFSRVVLANFSVTGKLDGLFQGPRGERFHPRGTRASAVDRGGGVSGGLMIWDQVNMCFVYVCAAEECAGVVAY